MLVSHSKKFIFLKTVKTAGTSVEGFLERYCLPPTEKVPSHGRRETVSSYGIVGARKEFLDSYKTYYSHMPAFKVRNAVGPEIWSTYQKITVIRNPYEKTISQFFFFHKYHKNKTYHTASIDEIRSDLRAHIKGGNLPIDRGIYTIDGLSIADITLRFEYLECDLSKLSNSLDLEFSPSALPSYKSGIRPRHALSKDLLDREMASIIEQAFDIEFQTFGYPLMTFGPKGG